jgi:hypothetical protein
MLIRRIASCSKASGAGRICLDDRTIFAGGKARKTLVLDAPDFDMGNRK